MSTDTNLEIDSPNLEATLALASNIGQHLRGGEVIELISDLGGGKTAFVRGLAKGMGSLDQVSSPSFTLTNEYQAPPLTMHHFDLYRLQEPGILADELQELLADDQAVIVVEWAGLVTDILPEARLRIAINVTSETSRRFSINYPLPLEYLVDELGGNA